MSQTLRRLLLLAVRTDAWAVRIEEGWETRCLHCRARVTVGTNGNPDVRTTLEHIVPRSWFDRRAAAGFIEGLTGPDDPQNLALACRRCNHGKGSSIDAGGPSDARSREVVAALLATRSERFRTAEESVTEN